jgi:hypothetical protein
MALRLFCASTTTHPAAGASGRALQPCFHAKHMEGVPAVEHTEVCVALHALADRAFKLANVAAIVRH